MDNDLYQNWVDSGAENTNLVQKGNQSFKVSANNAVFDNISLLPNETRSIGITFNFLTDELTDKTDFYYHFVQRYQVTDDIIGGKTFHIIKSTNNFFDADAGEDKEIDKTESVTLIAEEINETAVYNWYDPEGILIHTGTDLTVSPDINKQYQLEIIKDSDGFKDYDDVNVAVNPYVLGTITPNPATDLVTIDYIADEATSAYLILTDANTNNSNNYIIDINQTQIIIDISDYTTGMYYISLVCDGNFESYKTLVVN